MLEVQPKATIPTAVVLRGTIQNNMPKKPPTPNPRKLDKSRALAILGFATARPLEACFGKPDKAREMLDEALFKKTQEILHGETSLPAPKKPERRRSISR